MQLCLTVFGQIINVIVVQCVHVPIVSNGMAYAQPPYDHAIHLGFWDACYLLSSY
jgi:hypothetical protein